jgi:hypothetical protein
MSRRAFGAANVGEVGLCTVKSDVRRRGPPRHPEPFPCDAAIDVNAGRALAAAR